MASKAEIEAYVTKHQLEKHIQEAISELVKEGMPDDALTVLGKKLLARGKSGVVYHRITKIPIKEGSMPEIVAVAHTDAMMEVIKTFVGFNGVEALSVDGSTMITPTSAMSGSPPPRTSSMT